MYEILNSFQILEAMSCFGKIEKINLDALSGKYAIVEFDQEISAHKAIFEGKISIGHVSFISIFALHFYPFFIPTYRDRLHSKDFLEIKK